LLESSELDSAKKDQIKKLWAIYFGEIQNEPEGDVKSLDDLMYTSVAQEETEKWIKCSMCTRQDLNALFIYFIFVKVTGMQKLWASCHGRMVMWICLWTISGNETANVSV
jgi:hypothetical protein